MKRNLRLMSGSRILLCGVLVVAMAPSGEASAQEAGSPSVAGTVAAAEAVPFDSPRWQLEARESRLEEHLGRPSLYLKGGLAFLRDVELTDGVIEFDVAFSRGRGFMGGIWRLTDSRNYEEFYVRPHQSGNPDANQYTPVFHGLAGWQLYHGEGYGAAVDYVFDHWLPVKIVFSGSRGEVYLGGDEPALVIAELKRPVRAGKIGVEASSFAPAHFSNFRFRALEGAQLRGASAARPDAPPGTVRTWSVSTAFDASRLGGKVRLEPEDKRDLSWTPLAAESTGITNLARVQGAERGADTVFARLEVTSSGDQVKKLRFGYSDRVKVYFEDRLVYGGDNTYRSRDYRYLGTIGLFDELYLPLREGRNEVWFAVSEAFGGWGLWALFDDPEGLTLAGR